MACGSCSAPTPEATRDPTHLLPNLMTAAWQEESFSFYVSLKSRISPPTKETLLRTTGKNHHWTLWAPLCPYQIFKKGADDFFGAEPPTLQTPEARVAPSSQGKCCLSVAFGASPRPNPPPPPRPPNPETRVPGAVVDELQLQIRAVPISILKLKKHEDHKALSARHAVSVAEGLAGLCGRSLMAGLGFVRTEKESKCHLVFARPQQTSSLRHGPQTTQWPPTNPPCVSRAPCSRPANPLFFAGEFFRLKPAHCDFVFPSPYLVPVRPARPRLHAAGSPTLF